MCRTYEFTYPTTLLSSQRWISFIALWWCSKRFVIWIAQEAEIISKRVPRRIIVVTFVGERTLYSATSSSKQCYGTATTRGHLTGTRSRRWQRLLLSSAPRDRRSFRTNARLSDKRLGFWKGRSFAFVMWSSSLNYGLLCFRFTIAALIVVCDEAKNSHDAIVVVVVGPLSRTR